MAKGWRAISIREELVNEVESLIREMPSLGYRSVSEFVGDAVREYLKKHKRLEHFNVNEDHVTIVDRVKKRIVDVYFRNGKIWCELCKRGRCEHTTYALNIPKVRKLLREKGWIIEDSQIIYIPP
jgi:Arc/MetJ-type ribon-helix-helix transcriptional regulator